MNKDWAESTVIICCWLFAGIGLLASALLWSTQVHQSNLQKYDQELSTHVDRDEAAIVKAKNVQWNGYRVEVESKKIGKLVMMVSVENYSAIQIGDRICVEYDFYESQVNNLRVCKK